MRGGGELSPSTRWFDERVEAVLADCTAPHVALVKLKPLFAAVTRITENLEPCPHTESGIYQLKKKAAQVQQELHPVPIEAF